MCEDKNILQEAALPKKQSSIPKDQTKPKAKIGPVSHKARIRSNENKIIDNKCHS